MVRSVIRKVFNAFDYEIVKLDSYSTEKYKIKSTVKGLNLYDTPTGKYYLPNWLKADIVANKIKAGKYFEPEVIDIAKQYIKKDSVVLDVGANYGQMSVVFSDLAWDGLVYSFEAEPVVFEILKKNLEANNCMNVKPVLGAVYNTVGKKLVFPEPDFKRFSSFGSYGIAPNATQGRTVESITIDSLAIPGPISFMKVDIQGSDLFALQGARETIVKNKMPILFEFEQDLQSDFQTSFNDYVDFFRSVNYRFDKIIGINNYLVLPK